jgi:beta-glucosidase-like glycosyl hydrolase
VQSKGVLAVMKHFALNNQETHRNDGSSNVDERTLHEIYLPPFVGAVHAGVASVMCGCVRARACASVAFELITFLPVRADRVLGIA